MKSVWLTCAASHNFRLYADEYQRDVFEIATIRNVCFDFGTESTNVSILAQTYQERLD